MKQNMGYRLGKRTRRFMSRISDYERALQQRGAPGWLSKIPRYVLLAVIAGLLLTGAFYLLLFLAIVAFVAFYLSAVRTGMDIPGNDEYLSGYHAMGPEGPGMYVAGKKVSDDDEDDAH
ncbi:DUF3742 family protein [Citrobacter sp. S2-9]|uniref:DUF3742 family protein n=1 Tax=Citrobacter enshiensis TaxID=2971264 RepID=A0ABT8PWH3_9ENTR|nr:DUF3742 family protein [Citrobacter enshiensis]MDN8600322.1 DUF3742 family protein [Citrobacter enshiensis]